MIVVILQLWLMLFSDIVLLTQRSGKLFVCVENPMELDNLMVPDINCNERKALRGTQTRYNSLYLLS